MHVGDKTTTIGKLSEEGHSVSEIAKMFDISERSVEKRVASYQRNKSGYYLQKNESQRVPSVPNWSEEMLKAGFDQFIAEHGRLPSSSEIDEVNYLPTARSIQRSHGGLVALRTKLGYEDTNFGVGMHRSAMAQKIGVRGLKAEDELEKVLIKKFGEVFIHSQRGYGSIKTSFDFLIYCKNKIIGVDVFASNSKFNIQKNINIKLKKYIAAPAHVKKIFVVYPTQDISQSMEEITANMNFKSDYPNFDAMFVDDFIEYLDSLTPLKYPEDVRSFYSENADAL